MGERIAKAATARAITPLFFPSGAGHDAMVVGCVIPSAMMFVPSIGGISHHWSENTSDEDLVLGAQVFADGIAIGLKT